MKWSKLKQNIEDFIAPSLADRVRYWTTQYRYGHESVGRAWITVDKQEILSCTLTDWLKWAEKPPAEAQPIVPALPFDWPRLEHYKNEQFDIYERI